MALLRVAVASWSVCGWPPSGQAGWHDPCLFELHESDILDARASGLFRAYLQTVVVAVFWVSRDLHTSVSGAA